ncbi:Major facilitator superfamily, partial [Globisporangium splendens]
MLEVFFEPESPRWTYQHKDKDAAEAVLNKLRQTENVGRQLTAIGDQIAEEGETVGWTELLQPSISKRVLIAMALQVLQLAIDINPMFSYDGLISKDVVGDGVMSVLILSIVDFVSTIPAMRRVDTFGRRQLLLVGAVGMVLGRVLSGITFTAGCDGNTDDSGRSKTAEYIIIVDTALFISNFAISWGPVCWIYPAEIFPMNVRAPRERVRHVRVAVDHVQLGHGHVHGVGRQALPVAQHQWRLLLVLRHVLLLEDIESLFVKDGGKQKFGNASPKYVEVQTPQVSSV